MMATVPQRAPSPPTQRPSFAEKLGAKLQRVLSNEPPPYDKLNSAAASITEQERSRSRGREFQIKSSGRGGAGNIRSFAAVDEGSYIDSVPVRGREANPSIQPSVAFTGRGGAGNFRSPSRDPVESAPRDAAEDELILRSIDGRQNGVHSSGRGGAGNIRGGKASPSPARATSSGRDQSESRSRSRARGLHSTGRGGAGNLMAGETPYMNEAAIEEEEAERRAELEDARERAELARGRAGVVHSTGRGGAANMTALPAPGPDQPVLHHEPHAVESSGRGGAGNILHSLTRGRAREAPAGGDDGTGAGSREPSAASRREASVEGIWNRIKHPLSPRGKGDEKGILE